MPPPAAPDARLHGWIARAAFPEERWQSPAFAAADAQEAVVVADRRASWEAVFAGDDAESAARLAALKTDLLRARGVTEAEWRLGLRDYVVCAPADLPAWAATFIELYRGWRGESATPGKPHLLLTAVWAESSRAWAQARADEMRAAGLRLTDAAVDDLLEYLTLRLATPVFAVWSSWPGAWPGGAGGDGDNGDNQGGDRWRFLRDLEFWDNAFDRQPILAHIIGHLTHLWRAATAEMLARLASDAPRLRAAGFLRAGDGKVTVLRLRCGLGDPHRGGRSVAIVETDCGDVVYKPKDLAGTRATGELLRELHAAHPEFTPLAPAFLRRRGYGWERRVRARECDSKAQVETFYRRLGGWLFLLQLLNGNDFWYDNLIACADMPFFIDYETVLGNSFTAPFAEQRGRPVGEQVEMFYQMQLIGILPLLMPGAVDGALADGIDISVATRPGKQPIPFPKIAGGVHDDFEASDYAPFYRGEFQDMNGYLDEFIAGYRGLAAAIESPAGRAALQLFRRRIKRARFRHIVIDTWSCYALLHTVFGNCRTDGARAAIFLDAVCARYRKYPRRVIEGIRRDVWRNDVPLFEMQADSLKLFNTAGDATEEDFFADTALAKTTRNRAYLRAHLDAQVARIKALFSTRPDRPRRRRPSVRAAPVSPAEMLDLAQQTGAQLAADLNRVDNLHDYLAIGRAQLNNIQAVQPLPADGHGAAGAVVFLAALRCQPDANSAARHAIERIDSALARCGRHLAEARITAFERGPDSGVLSAFGGQLLALGRLARAPTAAGFDAAAAARRMLDGHLEALSPAASLCADYRHGVCGLLYCLLELAPLFAADTATAWLARILSAIERKPLQPHPPQTESYRQFADAFSPPPHMRAIDRMMRLRWPAFTAHAGYRKLRRMIAASAAPAAPAPASPKSLRDMPSEKLLDRAYCLLAAGDRDNAGDHGNAGDWRAPFDRHLAELVARRRASGRWFPDRWADDCFWPGAVHGQGDIGLLLLSAARGANLNPYRAPAPVTGETRKPQC